LVWSGRVLLRVKRIKPFVSGYEMYAVTFGIFVTSSAWFLFSPYLFTCPFGDAAHFLLLGFVYRMYVAMDSGEVVNDGNI
jgi:hypothetical protein